jgi:prolyl-tRNA editing enzyme YbaK/EbsC (Cys-tRNA(Pro) deacylase)
MPDARTPADLAQWLAERQVQAELIREIGETPTVPAAAEALGVPVERIIKTLLFLVSMPNRNHLPPQDLPPPQPVVVISNGVSRVDRRAIAGHYGVGRKQVSLATPTQVLAELGYPAGGVPPFGHRHTHPVLLDQPIADFGPDALVYGGGGDDRTMLALSVGELLRITQPAGVLPLSE